MTAEREGSREVPEIFPFTPYQDKFLTWIVERRYSDFDFSKLEDEDSVFFREESHRFASDFRGVQQSKIRNLWAENQLVKVEQLRSLDFVDLVRFAHNGCLEWETRAGVVECESDDYIEACNEAYEWLKISRLAEYAVAHGQPHRRKRDDLNWSK